MSLLKKSITDEQEERVRYLLSQRTKIGAILKKVGVSRTTLWRNMVFLGIEKTPPKKSQTVRSKEYFDYKDYK